jgi:hypothetical protein
MTSPHPCVARARSCDTQLRAPMGGWLRRRLHVAGLSLPISRSRPRCCGRRRRARRIHACATTDGWTQYRHAALPAPPAQPTCAVSTAVSTAVCACRDGRSRPSFDAASRRGERFIRRSVRRRRRSAAGRGGLRRAPSPRPLWFAVVCQRVCAHVRLVRGRTAAAAHAAYAVPAARATAAAAAAHAVTAAAAARAVTAAAARAAAAARPPRCARHARAPPTCSSATTHHSHCHRGAAAADNGDALAAAVATHSATPRHIHLHLHRHLHLHLYLHLHLLCRCDLFCRRN